MRFALSMRTFVFLTFDNSYCLPLLIYIDSVVIAVVVLTTTVITPIRAASARKGFPGDGKTSVDNLEVSNSSIVEHLTDPECRIEFQVFLATEMAVVSVFVLAMMANLIEKDSFLSDSQSRLFV